MSKCAKWRAGGLILCILGGLSAGAQSAVAGDTPASEGARALSSVLLDRAQNEVVRIRALVEQGTLPKSLLEEAEARLADAQDQAILTATLYGAARLQDMTPQQATAMLEAAQRRVDRQSRIVADRQKLLDGGIISRSEFTLFENELDSRNRVLDLAQNRARLLEQLRAMAETEQQLERAAHAPAEVLIRYDGNGLFNLGDLPTISSEFEKRFHHPLPISAFGQTLVHQSMGLDHRNRVDVALNPDQVEGIWLRQLLEKLHVPYLAFRSAMAGAATAPHIHIGPGSTRLKLASR
ncbi:MAG TPA: hypothetical protein VHU83_19375 [Bryobacteraceae bacterium]|jgi:hypothetical protein|nr:hypothetical protein [Bryobacteraceae bacterium]